jgi:hypothetical protein
MQWIVTSVFEPMTEEGIAIVNSILLSTAGRCLPTNKSPFADMFSDQSAREELISSGTVQRFELDCLCLAYAASPHFLLSAVFKQQF